MMGITQAVQEPKGNTPAKASPLSVKLGAERLAKLDAYAARTGLTRHAAILQLMDVGLDPTEVVIIGDAGGRMIDVRPGARSDRLGLSIGPVDTPYGKRLKTGKAQSART